MIKSHRADGRRVCLTLKRKFFSLWGLGCFMMVLMLVKLKFWDTGVPFHKSKSLMLKHCEVTRKEILQSIKWYEKRGFRYSEDLAEKTIQFYCPPNDERPCDFQRFLIEPGNWLCRVSALNELGNGQSKSMTKLYRQGLKELCSKEELPKIEFVMNYGDGWWTSKKSSTKPFDGDEANMNPRFPVFRAAGCGPREELLLLRGSRFQDWYIPPTSEWRLTQIYNSGRSQAFEDKSPKAVFRGTPTGHQADGSYNLYNEQTWVDYTRTKLAMWSKNHSEELDAGFTGLHAQVSEKVKLVLEDMGLLRDKLRMADQTKYRYIIVPDGNTVADRLLRQMLSGSVIIKESSACRQSWFGMLQEEENYIPLPTTEGGLIRLIRKLNKEVWRGNMIAQNAVQTALVIGDLESFQRYNSDSLWCYYLGASKCAERFAANPCNQSYE